MEGPRTFPEERFVLYHGNCPDGFGAAWAVWLAVGGQATYIPVLYGQPLPELPDGAVVSIVDFSYSRKVLLELRKRCPALEVLDHHKSAEVELEGLDFCNFDMDRSGAILTWDSWHRREAPLLLNYVQDRDLWRFALPKSRAVTAWLWSYPRAFVTWSQLSIELQNQFDDVAREGEALLRLQAQQVEVMCRQALVMDVGGYRVPVANATVFFSDVGERLCQLYPEAPFAAYYLDRADGMRQWGLRSRGDFDVSLVAKGYGGGGHLAAAGFVQPIGCPLQAR
ncbi:MAG: hypothetical protein A2Y74_07610 [Actinobacteria bacterium RBG_13_63_9]|nr:MAG: hypothetical protein A2Y74_07610 [Actinobacteria bacterium RBG_13_63_9]